MSKTVTSVAPPQEPPLVIDESILSTLEDLAQSAAGRMPDLATRLLHEIGRANVLPSGKMPPDVVNIGSHVAFRDETTGKEQEVVLVLPAQADIAYGRISVLTPIGVALLGLRKGASISWDTRGGETRRLTVLSVTPPRDDDGGAPPPMAA